MVPLDQSQSLNSSRAWSTHWGSFRRQASDRTADLSRRSDTVPSSVHVCWSITARKNRRMYICRTAHQKCHITFKKKMHCTSAPAYKLQCNCFHLSLQPDFWQARPHSFFPPSCKRPPGSPVPGEEGLCVSPAAGNLSGPELCWVVNGPLFENIQGKRSWIGATGQISLYENPSVRLKQTENEKQNFRAYETNWTTLWIKWVLSL